MRKHYHFQIAGSGSDGNTWETRGKIHCEFHDSFDEAMQQTFNQLTQGKALYGKSGAGCAGPYDIDRVVIMQVKQ